ncbi:uncharacterized protein METZ01_LOCUS256093 [marine metagenome]|uniref:Uncharacterized protein n=1 Tax=marine metagenome TaxID=408172 RepID=A0A382IVA3_9ZZZZ
MLTGVSTSSTRTGNRGLTCSTKLVAGRIPQFRHGDIIIVAVIFGLVNTFIRPVVMLLSPPALLLTIDGPMSTLVGGLTVTVVSFALNLIVKD